jgi:pyruvate/2-oxoglutarate dehydrogenase complex dihydrolipoamide acyltransferase (E2) component
VTPKLRPKRTSGPIAGTGPGGRIEPGDIEAKLQAIQGDANETAERAKPTIAAAAVGGVVLLILVAFVLGRRRGRRKSTWVEIRRL